MTATTPAQPFSALTGTPPVPARLLDFLKRLEPVQIEETVLLLEAFYPRLRAYLDVRHGAVAELAVQILRFVDQHPHGTARLAEILALQWAATPHGKFHDHPAAPLLTWLPCAQVRLAIPAEDDDSGQLYGPYHWVGPFALGVYPVTRAEYARFRAATRHSATIHGPEDNLPVAGVAWFEAMEYCAWLSELCGRGYRLPSEAEWEYAAGGDDPDADEPAPGGLHPVGRGEPNSFGLYDMNGDLWEWTASPWQEIYQGDEHRCLSPAEAETRQCAVRGRVGALPEWVTRLYRERHWPSDRIYGIGFRVARVPDFADFEW